MTAVIGVGIKDSVASEINKVSPSNADSRQRNLGSELTAGCSL